MVWASSIWVPLRGETVGWACPALVDTSEVSTKAGQAQECMKLRPEFLAAIMAGTVVAQEAASN